MNFKISSSRSLTFEKKLINPASYYRTCFQLDEARSARLKGKGGRASARWKHPTARRRWWCGARSRRARCAIADHAREESRQACGEVQSSSVWSCNGRGGPFFGGTGALSPVFCFKSYFEWLEGSGFCVERTPWVLRFALKVNFCVEWDSSFDLKVDSEWNWWM